MVNNINKMNQTKTLYIANYLELNNNVSVSVCKEGCDQILGVPYNSNEHGNINNCINMLYDIVSYGVVTPEDVVTTDLYKQDDFEDSSQCEDIFYDCISELDDDDSILCKNIEDIDFKKIPFSKITRCNIVNSHGKLISTKNHYNSIYKDLLDELSPEERSLHSTNTKTYNSDIAFYKVINIIKKHHITIDIDIKLDDRFGGEIVNYTNSTPEHIPIITVVDRIPTDTGVDRILRDSEKIMLETSGKRNRCWAYVIAAAWSKSLNDMNWKDHLQRDISDETILQFLESALRGMEQEDFRKHYCCDDDNFVHIIKEELTYNIRDIRKSVKNVFNEFASYHIFAAMICDKDNNAPLKRYGKLKMYKSGNSDYHNIQDNKLDTLEVAHTDGNHFSFVL